MDELSQKLNEILNDPESMEQVRKMADSIFSEDSQNNSDNGNSPSGEQMQQIMELLSMFNNAGNDDRAKLITSLKPYLSEKRREKADNAIKLLKLLEILPHLKNSGLFNL